MTTVDAGATNLVEVKSRATTTVTGTFTQPACAFTAVAGSQVTAKAVDCLGNRMLVSSAAHASVVAVDVEAR